MLLVLHLHLGNVKLLTSLKRVSRLPEGELLFCLGVQPLVCGPRKASSRHLAELLRPNEVESAIYCTYVCS